MRFLPLALLLAVAAPSPCGSFLSVPSVGRPLRPLTTNQVCQAPTKASAVLPGFGGTMAGGSPASTRCRMQEAPKEDVKQREFDLARGTAVDTLLSDYNNLFVTPADYSIFHDKIVLRDVQGFTLEGLKSYKLFFKTVQKLVSAVFSNIKVSVLLMDKYGADRSKIKLRWRLELGSRGLSWRQIWGWLDRNGDGVISKAEVKNLGEQQKQSEEKDRQQRQAAGTTWNKADNYQSPLVIEGVSEYTLDAKGKILQHEITISYPASPWSLAPLRELLPVRRATGLAGVAGVVASPLPHISVASLPHRPHVPAAPAVPAGALHMSAVPPSPLSPFLGADGVCAAGGGGGWV